MLDVSAVQSACQLLKMHQVTEQHESCFAAALQEVDRHSYDIHLEAALRPGGCSEETVVTRTNFKHLCAVRGPESTRTPPPELSCMPCVPA